MPKPVLIKFEHAPQTRAKKNGTLSSDKIFVRIRGPQ